MSSPKGVVGLCIHVQRDPGVEYNSDKLTLTRGVLLGDKAQMPKLESECVLLCLKNNLIILRIVGDESDWVSRTCRALRLKSCVGHVDQVF